MEWCASWKYLKENRQTILIQMQYQKAMKSSVLMQQWIQEQKYEVVTAKRIKILAPMPYFKGGGGGGVQKLTRHLFFQAGRNKFNPESGLVVADQKRSDMITCHRSLLAVGRGHWAR
jgi:hypothetical protein